MSKELDDESSSKDLRIKVPVIEIPQADLIQLIANSPVDKFPKEGAVPEKPKEGETPQDPATAKTGPGTVTGIFKVILGSNQVMVVVTLDSGGTTTLHATEGRHSIGQRVDVT